MPLLFAYGTLRPGAKSSPPDIAAALAKAAHLGRATASGRLHWMGRYPAMVRAEQDRVIGDVYRIDEAQCAELWPLLDSYEGDAYVRETIVVTLETGAEMTAPHLEAFVYLARDPAALGPRIDIGDFLA
ncbi:MAG: gamma-glutamylcyclotransferase [Hyphomonadaceae bacterium]|nr:gamma-glutamylcyclotransferase [Hyphomonadaceae bacterium]